MEILSQVLLVSMSAILLFILYKRALRLLTRDRINASYAHVTTISRLQSGALSVEVDMPEAGRGEFSFELDGKPVGAPCEMEFVAGASNYELAVPKAVLDHGFMLVLKLENQTIRRGVSPL
ncbi:MAG: hypothetical protein P8M07_03010 [Flavobacteriales bacterium]|nr:hypothetical protein [Flavobacteriales bacterium]